MAMTARSATDELELLELGYDDRGPAPPHRRQRGDERPRRIPQHAYLTGLVLGLAGILMFFLALVSAFVVRKGLGGDWAATAVPGILWFNTGVLMISSLTLERARRALRAADIPAFRAWWGFTTTLGVGFLAGQIVAWRQLAEAGVFLASNPSSSFFYLLTGAHGVHLLGGVLALTVVGLRGERPQARLSRRTAASVAGLYWHFMGLLWVCLFLLLLLGQ
jgi:cytochrome c oxidase subunit 3